MAWQQKKIPEILLPFVEEKIFKNPDASIRVQAGNYFNRPGVGKVFAIQDISKLPADIARGKAVFTSFCSSCHKVDTTGNTIGPELTDIGKKFDKTALLDAIINPSAAIVFGYEPWLVNTKDGASLYGFLISDNKRIIVLKDISGQKHIIPVNKISKKIKQEISFMPDPVSGGLTEQNLADVAGYLLNAQKNSNN